MARYLDQFPLYDALIKVDDSGNLTANMSEIWMSFMATFMESLQEYLSQDGIFVPRVTLAERDAMQNVVNGQMIYNTTSNKFQGYENGAWANLI